MEDRNCDEKLWKLQEGAASKVGAQSFDLMPTASDWDASLQRETPPRFRSSYLERPRDPTTCFGSCKESWHPLRWAQKICFDAYRACFQYFRSENDSPHRAFLQSHINGKGGGKSSPATMSFKSCRKTQPVRWAPRVSFYAHGLCLNASVQNSKSILKLSAYPSGGFRCTNEPPKNGAARPPR
jgi:hypothetical protein